tara:strand:- start:453 stop:689 length:237 start_codon:yes stop_codon:yes gene_type:complete
VQGDFLGGSSTAYNYQGRHIIQAFNEWNVDFVSLGKIFYIVFIAIAEEIEIEIKVEIEIDTGIETEIEKQIGKRGKDI